MDYSDIIIDNDFVVDFDLLIDWLAYVITKPLRRLTHRDDRMKLIYECYGFSLYKDEEDIVYYCNRNGLIMILTDTDTGKPIILEKALKTFKKD